MAICSFRADVIYGDNFGCWAIDWKERKIVDEIYKEQSLPVDRAWFWQNEAACNKNNK